MKADRSGRSWVEQLKRARDTMEEIERSERGGVQ